MSQFVTGVRAHATAFARNHVYLVLLVVMSPVMILFYGLAIARTFSAVAPALGIGSGVDIKTVGLLSGALFATAFLSGIVGLFQVISARRGDERLMLCGFTRHTLIATRLVTVVGASVLTTSVSFAVLWTIVPIESPFVAFIGLLFGGVTYGLIGMLVGALLPRVLEGSLLVLAFVDLDDSMTNGLFVPRTRTLPKLFPLYRPHGLLEAAVSDGTVAITHVIGAGVYLFIVAVLAVVVYVRVTGGRGVGV